MKALDWLVVSGVSPLLKCRCPVTIHVYLCFSFNQDGIVERIGISYLQFCWYSSTNCDGKQHPTFRKTPSTSWTYAGSPLSKAR